VRVLIVYDTRRRSGATAHVVSVIAETLRSHGIHVDVARPGQASVDGYDLVVVGSPIYEEQVMGSVARFLEENGGRLADKLVAVFIVCTAQMAGRLGAKYAERHYLPQLLRRLPRKPDAVAIFRGWFLHPNPETLAQAEKWAEELVRLLEERGRGR